MSNHTSRFVDRDMLMRYHIGLGVGHMYAPFQSPDQPTTDGQSGEEEDSGTMFDPAEISEHGSDESSASDGTTDEDDDEDWDENGEDKDEDDHSERSDEELATLDEMYSH
jgi:hypothetical protein